MSAIPLGDILENASVSFHWNTNAAGGGSITRAANGTVNVARSDGVDCTAGAVTDTEDSPALGVHHCVIDTAGNANFVPGYDYTVYLAGSTIDGETVNASIAHFSIENRGFSRANVVAGVVEANMSQIGGDAAALAKFLASVLSIIPITITGGTTTSVTTTSLSEQQAETYRNKWLVIRSGTGADQCAKVEGSSYAGGTTTLTISSIATAPVNGDEAVLV